MGTTSDAVTDIDGAGIVIVAVERLPDTHALLAMVRDRADIPIETFIAG